MDMNSLLYVALGAILIPFLAKLGIKVPLPGPTPTPDPNVPAPTPTPAPAPGGFNLAVLINAIVSALIERFLPHVQQVVRTELANRPTVVPADQPKIEALADGTFRIIPAKAVIPEVKA